MKIGDDEWRATVSAAAVGKTIESLEWEPARRFSTGVPPVTEEPTDGGYWVMTFTNGSEICFNLTMAEVMANVAPAKRVEWLAKGP